MRRCQTRGMRLLNFCGEVGRAYGHTSQLMGKAFFLWLVVLVSVLCWGQQTQLDLRTQGKNVDFSNATMTRPVKTGTVLPAQCAAGEMFFKSNAAAGANLYGCVAANTWAVQSGGTSLPSATGQTGKVLGNDGTSAQWQALGGDVTGAVGTNSVVRIQGRNVAASAPGSGQALAWNATSQQWEPQTVSGGGGGAGSLTVKSGGTVLGSRATLNLMAGSAMTVVGTDTGSEIEMQYLADTAVLETKANNQTGAPTRCLSAGGSTSAYSCGLSPALSAYTTGMRLFWQPDVTNTGAATLNVDLVGAVAVLTADGSALAAGDATAGRMYAVWYDGTGFRMLSGGGGSSGGGSTTLGTLSQIWCPLDNCSTGGSYSLGGTAARAYFFRFTPDRSRVVRRIAVGVYPWNGSTDTLGIGIYSSAGTKISECNTATAAVNVSGSFPVCALPAAVTMTIDTEYLMVVASQTATAQVSCTNNGLPYELHTLFGSQPSYFPGGKTLGGHAAGVATGTASSFTLPASLGAETSANYCRPQFVMFPQ